MANKKGQLKSLNRDSGFESHSPSFPSARFLDAQLTPGITRHLDHSTTTIHSKRQQGFKDTDCLNSLEKLNINQSGKVNQEHSSCFDSGLGSIGSSYKSSEIESVLEPITESKSTQEKPLPFSSIGDSAYGSDVNEQSRSGILQKEASIPVPILTPSESELTQERVHLLIWKESDEDGDTDAMIAAADGDDEFVQNATELCLKPDAFIHTNHFSQTILHVAAMCCNAVTTRALLTAGCDPSKKDIYGNTALHYAAMRGDADVIETLIKEPTSDELTHNNFEVPFKGSPSGCVNCLNHQGKSAIHLAAERCHRKVLEVLHKARYIDIDARRCTDGYSIAHIAINNEDMTLLEVCLELGVDSEVRNFAGYTPMQMARICGQEEMVELCKQKGASENQLENLDFLEYDSD